jgi:hypothetical protein
MTGHSLAVTACAFMRFANRLVSVSKDRSCRVSDALTGAVLRVFTAASPLVSVIVGPCDTVVACGTTNGGVVFFAPPQPATSAQQQCVVEPDQECKAVGPFSGSAEGPVFFLATIGGPFADRGNGALLGGAAAATASGGAGGSDSSSAGLVASAAELPHTLVAVSRDGFVQLYSWATGTFQRDVVRLKKGAAAACVVPPKWARFATTTVADRPLIQRSAVPLKKAPTAAVGPRAFMVRALAASALAVATAESRCVAANGAVVGSGNDGDGGAAVDVQDAAAERRLGFFRIRQRDDVDGYARGVAQRNAEWLRELELGLLRRHSVELLAIANELVANAEASAAGDS